MRHRSIKLISLIFPLTVSKPLPYFRHRLQYQFQEIRIAFPTGTSSRGLVKEVATETGCVGSPLTFSSLSSSLMAQRSWFSQKITQQTNGNYLRISSPLIQSSFADYKESVLPGKYFIFFI